MKNLENESKWVEPLMKTELFSHRVISCLICLRQFESVGLEPLPTSQQTSGLHKFTNLVATDDVDDHDEIAYDD